MVKERNLCRRKTDSPYTVGLRWILSTLIVAAVSSYTAWVSIGVIGAMQTKRDLCIVSSDVDKIKSRNVAKDILWAKHEKNDALLLYYLTQIAKKQHIEPPPPELNE